MNYTRDAFALSLAKVEKYFQIWRFTQLQDKDSCLLMILAGIDEMFMPYRKLVIVSEEQEVINSLKNKFPDLFYNSFVQSSCRDTSMIIVASMSNICDLNKLCEPLAKTKNLVTGRMKPGEMVPVHQPAHAVMLPWCSTQAFVNWVALLIGEANTIVFPEWFFVRNTGSATSKTVDKLTNVLQSLPAWNSYEIKSANVAAKVGCSQRYLEKLCSKLFGITPGQLFRAYYTFSITASLMQKEKILGNCRRRGCSPLAEIENDYRRSLKRLLGITYTELRHAATEQHWAAVWMRKWRKSLYMAYKP